MGRGATYGRSHGAQLILPIADIDKYGVPQTACRPMRQSRSSLGDETGVTGRNNKKRKVTPNSGLQMVASR